LPVREIAADQIMDPILPQGKLSRADLRRAIVLKEVLDRPVAERDPQEALGL